MDLTGPELLFVATVFQIRDGDAICVRNARLSKLRKVIQFFTAALVPARATATFAP